MISSKYNRSTLHLHFLLFFHINTASSERNKKEDKNKDKDDEEKDKDEEKKHGEDNPEHTQTKGKIVSKGIIFYLSLASISLSTFFLPFSLIMII